MKRYIEITNKIYASLKRKKIKNIELYKSRDKIVVGIHNDIIYKIIILSKTNNENNIANKIQLPKDLIKIILKKENEKI